MSEVGTLKELGVKPGDVVECVYEPSRAFIGIHMTINKNGYAEWNGGVFMPECDDEYNRKFRIISRANTTVNHNDGKWHGWNGGECPVHPDTVVEYMMLNGTRGNFVASEHSWGRSNDYENPCIAFRVIKEYKEPVATKYEGECWAYHYTNMEPTTLGHNAGGDCVHGTWKATHVDGKLQSFTWTADK